MSLAGDIRGALTDTGTSLGATNPDLIGIVGEGIKLILSILGVVFLALVIYGGFVWMVARGNKSEVTRGQEMIIQATIGLVIVLSAYALTYFIFDNLFRVMGIRA